MKEGRRNCRYACLTHSRSRRLADTHGGGGAQGRERARAARRAPAAHGALGRGRQGGRPAGALLGSARPRALRGAHGGGRRRRHRGARLPRPAAQRRLRPRLLQPEHHAREHPRRGAAARGHGRHRVLPHARVLERRRLPRARGQVPAHDGRAHAARRQHARTAPRGPLHQQGAQGRAQRAQPARADRRAREPRAALRRRHPRRHGHRHARARARRRHGHHRGAAAQGRRRQRRPLDRDRRRRDPGGCARRHHAHVR